MQSNYTSERKNWSKASTLSYHSVVAFENPNELAAGLFAADTFSSK